MALCARRLAWLRYWRSLVWWQLPRVSLQVLHRFPYQLNAVPVNAKYCFTSPSTTSQELTAGCFFPKSRPLQSVQ
jgi:hypothetical protein